MVNCTTYAGDGDVLLAYSLTKIYETKRLAGFSIPFLRLDSPTYRNQLQLSVTSVQLRILDHRRMRHSKFHWVHSPDVVPGDFVKVTAPVTGVPRWSMGLRPKSRFNWFSRSLAISKSTDARICQLGPTPQVQECGHRGRPKA